ncbi:MAG: Mur ligase family protein [Acidimicrobiales bacterium]
MRVLDVVILSTAAAGAGVGTLRWLRVAQREHYLAGAGARFACRWWASGRDNEVLFLLGVIAVVVSGLETPAGLVAAAVSLCAPRRLGLRGRTSRLAWTRRLSTVAVVSWGFEALMIATGATAAGVRGATVAAALAAMSSPAVVDAALAVTRPIEEVLAARFVDKAKSRLERVRPLVIAVTGSYGKTTVKGYLDHLISPHRITLASPKSFNNRAGLARTINELLGSATEILIAEMGTYGPGEIAGLCSWLRPEISVITAIGPAHLERFRSLDRTLAAKAEIAETARVVVVNGDDERLVGLAAVLRAAGKKVVEASGSNEVADVAVLSVSEGLELRVQGRRVGVAAVGASDQPTALSNAACAAAAAIEVGVAPEAIVALLATLPVAANRLQRYMGDGGYVVFDDTFNSNPAGARIGLARLGKEPRLAASGRRVVVTPGMVELGSRQRDENAALGEAAARVADTLVVVARTNRAALLAGAARARTPIAVTTVDRLDQGLEWVRATLGPGDAVLYENDLPDHFP